MNENEEAVRTTNDNVGGVVRVYRGGMEVVTIYRYHSREKALLIQVLSEMSNEVFRVLRETLKQINERTTYDDIRFDGNPDAGGPSILPFLLDTYFNKENPRASTLYIWGGLSMDDALSLDPALVPQTSIKRVDFTSVGFDERTIANLVEFFKRVALPEELIFRNIVMLKQEDWNRVFSAMLENPSVSRLKKLNATQIRYADRDVVAKNVATLLCSQRCKIENIDLGPTNFDVIANALPKAKALQILRMRTYRTFGWCKKIAEALKKGGSLRHLHCDNGTRLIPKRQSQMLHQAIMHPGCLLESCVLPFDDSVSDIVSDIDEHCAKNKRINTAFQRTNDNLINIEGNVSLWPKVLANLSSKPSLLYAAIKMNQDKLFRFTNTKRKRKPV